MSKNARRGMLLALCLVVVVGLVLTGCGKKEAALKEPGLVFTSYVKGTTVDFDDATYNNMAGAGGEAGFKYGIMQALYPTIFDANKDTVAQALFPAPYWKGDGVHTYYSFLTSSDQTAVQATIFATKLSAAEQQKVMDSIEGLFNRQTVDTSAAKALEQNTGYGILMGTDNSGTLAGAWKTDAAAWMAALNAKAAADYGGKTYAQLTLTQKGAVAAAMTVIDPELALYRAMAQTSFRNGMASATYPDKAEQMATTMYGKAYASLVPLVEAPRVDGAVWASCNTTEQAMVDSRVTGLFDLATAQVSDNVALTSNVYYGILFKFAGQVAADSWVAMVTPSTPGTGAEATAFYTILGAGDLAVGQATFKAALTQQYYGPTATYAGLSAASKAVIDQSDNGTATLSTVQRLPVLPLDQNALYATLGTEVSATAATGWKADVETGRNAVSAANLRQWAFYKWLAFESFRNGIAATYYPTQVAAGVTTAKSAGYISASTYAACNAFEKVVVNGMVWSGLGAGEQGYIATQVLPGLFGLMQAEMMDAVTLDQSVCYLTLIQKVDATSAAGFKKDVEAGTPLRAAFYRWLAKEQVKAMGSAAVLIRQSVGEFYIKITNPNEYAICVDQLKINFQTTAGSPAATVDGARQMLEDIWVPAKEGDTDGEVTVKVLAPTKAYDLISWLVMAGKDSNTARSMATEVFDKIQAGTIVWTFTADLQVSANDEVLSPTYSGAMTAA